MFISPNGFMRLDQSPPILGALPPSQNAFARYDVPDLPDDLKASMEQLNRGEFTGDPNALMAQFTLTMQGLMQRSISSGMTAFPVRENLEAEAIVLLPEETPIRNRTARRPGAGLATKWKTITSLGGGWGSSTDQDGGGTATQTFFAETGAPGSVSTVYADKTASYKLMGVMGAVTGFAMAAGANFQNQYAAERNYALRNFMLLEENALINGSSSSSAAPWGDGVTALGFDGLINLITTGNGVPSAQIQTSVGALTFAHIDAQLTRQWKKGAQGRYMVMNAQEIQSLKNLAVAANSIHRLQITDPTSFREGFAVTGYFCPITGELVPIIPSRFLAAGTILFNADRSPEGKPAFEIDVLPQVQLPELAPNQNVQGYVVQEIAPGRQAPQVFEFLISVYEVPKLKAATVFAKSTGVTAVS